MGKPVTYPACLALLFLLAGVSKITVSQSYHFSTYSVEHGLAQSQVLSVFQDARGYMWFGTNNGGVSRFDGNQFINIDDRHGLVNNVVFSISQDPQGRHLFGTNGGLSVYDGRTFRNFTDSIGLSHNRVLKLFRDSKGTVWIATRKGVCTWKDSQLKKFTADSTLSTFPILSIYEDSRGRIWFGTYMSDVFCFSDGKVKHYPLQNSDNENIFIKAIVEDRNKTVWFGSKSILNKLTAGDSIVPHEINQEGFTSAIRDRNNDVLFSSVYGIVKFNGKDFTNINEKNGLPSNQLFCVFNDNEGNYWFGSDGNGVSRLSSLTFINFGLQNDFPNEIVDAVFCDSKKNMWIGIQNGGLVKYNGVNFTVFKKSSTPGKNSLIENDVQAIGEDLNGNIFIGTKSGLSIYDGIRFNNHETSGGLTDNSIYSIKRDRNGGMWLGTKEGVTYYDGSTLSAVEIINNELKESKSVFRIFEDRDNNLWFSTEKGVLYFNRKTVTRYSAKNGFIDKRVLSIAQDFKGNMWFSTNEGVYSYTENSGFKLLDEKKGLISNKTYLLITDLKKNLWIGTNKGADRLDLSDYYDKNLVSIRHFGKEEGFTGVECNANAVDMDADGKIWFGTIRGVTVYDPAREKVNTSEPLTRITGIRLFHQQQDLSGFSESTNPDSQLPTELSLPFSHNHVTFDFIGISFTIPEKVRYMYKLQGLDEDWQPVTAKTEVSYPGLQPGNYTFFLKAMNSDGYWNKDAVTFSFTILPPWYRTWWFYSICALMVLAGFYAYTAIRTLNLRKAKLKLENEVALRTRELREEKEKVEVKSQEISEQKNIIEAKNRDITDSIQYAKNIQEALLPSIKNIHKEFTDCFILYLPKDIVSGDFYWYSLNGKKRYLAAVDCTGHGVPGAFMSIIGNNLLYEIVNERNITDPGKILSELHLGVKNALKQEDKAEERRDGMDIALCCIDRDDKQVVFSGAMRPLWIVRENGQLEQIRPDKFPIGGMDTGSEKNYTSHKVKINSGDTFYIFSDGYADQFGGHKGKKLMLRNFQKHISGIANLSMREQRENLEKHFHAWKGNLEQVDDVLVIGFRV